MPVDPEFQKKILAQIAKAKAAGGTELDLTNIQHADAQATAWVLKQIRSQLPQLTTLSLGDNWIGAAGAEALARAVQAGGLPLLTTLDLEANEIGAAGAEAIARGIQAGHWPNLMQLWLEDNDLNVDDAVLKSRDPRQIVAAILNGIIQPEVRIMFLGMGAVGKTWLYRRTFRNEIVDREAEQRRMTPDIDLIHPEACLWKPASMIPRVWDFSGQLITHGVHETFLASDGRTVCVLVLSEKRLPGENPDAEQESDEGNELPYWLKTIEHFAGAEVPVVIAISQCDRLGARNLDQPLTVIQENGASETLLIPQATPAQIKALFQIEATAIVDQLSACDATFSIEPLQHAIIAAASTLTAITRNKVPPKLPKLRDQVESQLTGRTIVAVDEYRNWCRENETTELREQETYLTIFRAMGSLFYFGRTPAEKEWIREDRDGYYRSLPDGQRRSAKQEPSFLLNKYIINPHWLKLAVYQVIRQSENRCWMSQDEIERQIAEANGAISGSHVARPPTGEETGLVIDFLKLVDLCYRDEEWPEYLFPRGLPKGTAAVATEWPGLKWKWRYLSEAMFDRFVVEMHRRNKVVKAAKAWQHWRLAVLIEDDRCQCLIEVNPAAGELSLRFSPASSSDSKSFVTRMVRDEFVRLVGKEPSREFPLVGTMPPAMMPVGLQAVQQTGGVGAESLSADRIDQDRAAAKRQVCAILAGGQFIGTGILVGEKRILTNRHVHDRACAADPSLKRWEAVFDYTKEEQSFDNLPRVPIHVPSPLISSPQDKLDYAFLDLKQVPDGDRGILTAHQGHRMQKDLPVHVLSYRGKEGPPVAGENTRPLPLEERSGRFLSIDTLRSRFAHDAVTTLGSSGSPVVDENFQWVGLHHEGKEGHGNHAILMSAIWDDLPSDKRAELLKYATDET